MVACGSLQQIFDKPSPLETPKASFEDSWKHINPIKAIDDMFSELHFNERNDSLPSTKHYQCSSSLGMNSESLSMCTEGLGFESFDDVEDMKDQQDVNIDPQRNHHQQQERMAKREVHVSEMLPIESKRSRIKGMGFPPPISSIGMSGKPWVYLESYRSNGRFILKEVKIPTQELLHACREDGRLKLQFIQSDGEALNEEDDDEETKNGGEVGNIGDGTGSNEIIGESP